MSTTLDAISSSSTEKLRLQFVIAIEGYPYLLTNGDAAAAVSAWEGEPGSDWADARGGVTIQWKQSQRIHPWEPFSSNGSSVTLLVPDDDANLTTFGEDVFNREGGSRTRIVADLLPDAVTLPVQSTSGFASGGVAYLGPEAVAYASTAAGEFQTCTRGYYSPFLTGTGGRFSRLHRATSTLEGPDPISVPATAVCSIPTTWKGRWAAIYAHRVVGATLDLKSEAHLVFAGRIANVGDTEAGHTSVTIDDMRRSIMDTVIMREQWRARLEPTVYVAPTDVIRCRNARNIAGTLTSLTANPLRGVESGAATVNEIDAGHYTFGELTNRINEWLAAEKTAGRLLFRHALTFDATDSDGNPRCRLIATDPTTTTVNTIRGVTLNADHWFLRQRFGWGADGIGDGSYANAHVRTFYSSAAPNYVPYGTGQNGHVISFAGERGQFNSQASTLPPAFSSATFTATGALRIGNVIVPCNTPTGGLLTINQPVNTMVGLDADPNWLASTFAGSGPVEMSQVLVVQATLRNLVLHFLASTGSVNFNWANYDIFRDHCGAAIPYDLISELDTDLAAVPGANDVMTVIVDGATRLADLFNSSFIMRTIQFVWRQGKLRVKALATPTDAATITLSNATKFAPAGTNDRLRAIAEESDELMRNSITIKHNGTPLGGEYRDTTMVVDPASASAHGSRALTITARNAIRGAGQAGEDITALLPGFSSAISLLGRPLIRVSCPIGFTEFETHTAGEAVLITDSFVRGPATGERGLSARPAFILSDWHDWAAGVGEVTVLVFAGLTLAPYSPCARVDETYGAGGFTAGYNNATATLRCVTNYHSPAGGAKDASNFAINDAVTIVEIDPDTAASPLSWDRTIAAISSDDVQVSSALGGFDSTKLYRIIAQGYSAATTTQRTKAFQADDADGMVANLRAPYALAHFGAGQTTTYVDSAATDLPAKPPAMAYGDGKPLDTGHAYDTATAINNLISYKTAIQTPEVVEAASYAGAGSPTWYLVYCAPVFLGVGLPVAGARTRKLYVSPTILKSSGVSATVRVTLSHSPPTSTDPLVPSREDVLRHAPYVETTFTTTAVAWENQAAVGLNTAAMNLAPGLLGGLAWVSVEIATNAQFRGFGMLRVGPLEAP